MRKLRLDLDRLEVESFELTPAAKGPKTVFGRMDVQQAPPSDYDCAGGGGVTASDPACIGPTYCCNPTANTGCCPAPTWQASCAWSCNGTCGNTCPVSCPPEYCTP